MKTAVQAVFAELEEMHPNLFNVYTTEGKQFVHHFHKYIAMEREQIVKAYESLEHRHGENYYNETFKPE